MKNAAQQLNDQADKAFDYAIETGILSVNETDSRYAGNYMFMGYDARGLAQFKNIVTREYIRG